MEACIPGGWYLISDLLEDDDHELDIAISSKHLDLLDKVETPAPMASHSHDSGNGATAPVPAPPGTVRIPNAGGNGGGVPEPALAGVAASPESIKPPPREKDSTTAPLRMNSLAPVPPPPQEEDLMSSFHELLSRHFWCVDLL